LLIGSPEDAHPLHISGVTELVKPFTLEHLLDTIAELLESVDRS
jgi:hypothetical protein